MSTTSTNGVLTVREGAQRLRWAHELDGTPAPRHVSGWQIAGLWPDEATGARIRQLLRRGEPVLVVLDHEPPLVELPAEHVGRVPVGVVAQLDADSDFVSLRVPLLDWLPPAERERGLAFLEHARAVLAGTPRFLLPPLLLETGPLPVAGVRFAHTTGNGPLSDSLLREAVTDLFHRPVMPAHPEPSHVDHAFSRA